MKNTKEQQEKSGSITTGFENAGENQFPPGWEGMNNINVQKYQGKKWLAMTKDGYWYPRQFNKEIKDGFSLSFDVSRNKDVSYYSGLFTITPGEIPYDNAGEGYRPDKSRRMFKSLYDSYAGGFNRVALWFDPHWNSGGQLTVYTYNIGETVKFKTQIPLPEFFKDKNKHQLTIRRKGNGLPVMDNGKTIADLPGVFISTVRYNLYTFSKYKENKQGEDGDVFYLKNINAVY